MYKLSLPRVNQGAFEREIQDFDGESPVGLQKCFRLKNGCANTGGDCGSLLSPLIYFPSYYPKAVYM